MRINPAITAIATLDVGFSFLWRCRRRRCPSCERPLSLEWPSLCCESSRSLDGSGIAVNCRCQSEGKQVKILVQIASELKVADCWQTNCAVADYCFLSPQSCSYCEL